jgi:hypothetical protein
VQKTSTTSKLKRFELICFHGTIDPHCDADSVRRKVNWRKQCDGSSLTPDRVLVSEMGMFQQQYQPSPVES